MGGFIGISIFIVHRRIRRKILLISLWTFYTLRKCGGLVLIRFIGSYQGLEVLKLKVSIFLSTLLFILSLGSLVWQSKVPSRVAFFSWSASLGMILTIDNFRKRRIIGLDWYYMCKRRSESVDHLLLHCPIAFESWSLEFCMFGLD